MPASQEFIEYACAILVKNAGIKRARDIVAELRVGPSQSKSVRVTLERLSARLEEWGQ